MYDYKLIRSKRRTIQIEISPSGEVFLRAPKWCSVEEIERYAKSKERWVANTLRKLERTKQAMQERGVETEPLTKEELQAITAEAKAEFKNLVDLWAPVVLGRGERGINPREKQLSIFDLPGLAPGADAEVGAPPFSGAAPGARACEEIAAVPGAPLTEKRVRRISIRHQSTRWGSCSQNGNLNFNCLLMLAPQEVRDYVVVHELCHLLHMNHSKAFWKEVARVLPGYRKPYNWLKENGTLLMARLPRE